MSIPPPPLDDPTVSDPLECPPLRWGLIGCGRVSHDFTQALKLLPTAKVVACSARSAESAKVFAEKHGIEQYCKWRKSKHFFQFSLLASIVSQRRRNLTQLLCISS